MADEFPAWLYLKQGIICCFMLLPLLLFYLKQKRKELQIRRWQKSLNIQAHLKVLHQLYQHVDGFKLSRKARQQSDAFEYVYGEIELMPFIALLSLARPNKDTVFYDLGSGTGKAVLACAMVFPVRKSIGVELFPELFLCAQNQVKQLAEISGYAGKAKKINFIVGNFFKVDLYDATLIFINSTALFGSIWEELCARLDKLPALITVITVSKTLVSSEFSLIRTTKIQMSWGIVLAYIHMRKTYFH